jgi:hypothetical protein
LHVLEEGLLGIERSFLDGRAAASGSTASPPPPPPPQRQRPRQDNDSDSDNNGAPWSTIGAADLRLMIEIIRAGDPISPQSAQFVGDMEERARVFTRVSVSPKQQKWLRDLASRAKAKRARA